MTTFDAIQPEPAHNKERNMENGQIKNIVGTIAPAARYARYPSPLHELLRVTPSEVEEDLRARGKTPEQVLGEIDAVVDKMRAQRAPKAPGLHAGFFGDFADNEDDGLGSLRFYEESVAAGIPTGDGGDVPYRKARGSDFFGQQDWKSMFVARVSGWSMRGDHITDGDVVLVDSNARPKDGDIVLAYIAGEGQVVKRLRLTDGERMILESANPDFKPIVIDNPANVSIRGVVKGRAGQV
jgi:hypothetical protein